ncbi:YycC family protein [Cohnella yongneupensis]|uniref:YycC family protein n=1 Tax=Cohnella yongneupensis TaxID=425006 RepID=A0ABW0R681_9BACL
MRPLPISADTAQKLAAFMKVPLEHLMHMPQHALLQKLGEMAMANAGKDEADNANSGEGKHNA